MSDNGGKWRKGQSGNPTGRPKVVGEIKELARLYTEDALNTLVGVCNNPDAPPAARVAAAAQILDRGYGRPTQSIDNKIEILDMGRVAADALMELSRRARESQSASIEAHAVDVTPVMNA